MHRWVLLLIAGCLAEAKEAPPTKIVPTGPCPDITIPWGREVYPGCIAQPIAASGACPRGDCPAVCEIELEQAGKKIVQTVSYDAAGRWTATKTKGGSTKLIDDVTCSYRDGRFDACTITNDGTDRTSKALKRDARGRLVEVELPSGTATLTYTADGRVETIDNGSAVHTHRYDKGGRLISLHEKVARKLEGTTTFSYNSAGSVTQARGVGPFGDIDTWTFSYDARGRLAKVVQTSQEKDKPVKPGMTETYRYDADDRLVETKRTGAGPPTTLRYRHQCR